MASVLAPDGLRRRSTVWGVTRDTAQPAARRAVMSKPCVVSIRPASSWGAGAAPSLWWRKLVRSAHAAGVWATRQDATRCPCSSLLTTA